MYLSVYYYNTVYTSYTINLSTLFKTEMDQLEDFLKGTIQRIWPLEC